MKSSARVVSVPGAAAPPVPSLSNASAPAVWWRGEGVALLAMLGSVVLGGLTPLIILLGDGLSSPFLFNGFWRLGTLVGVFGILLLFYFRWAVSISLWRRVAASCASWSLALACVNGLEFAFFSWSARFVDPAVTSVIFYSWPLFFIIFGYFVLRGGPGSAGARRRRNLGLLVPLGLVVLVGLGYVVFSESGRVFGTGVDLFSLSLGAGFSLLAALTAAAGVFSIGWGLRLAVGLGPLLSSVSGGSLGISAFRRSMFFALAGYLVVCLASVVLNLVVGFLSGERLLLSFGSGLAVAGGPAAGGLALGSLLFAFFLGGMAHSAHSYLLRAANFRSLNLGVNGLNYLAPALSLVLLAFFWGIEVARVDYLALGTGLIVGMNMLLNLGAAGLLRWVAAAVALGLAGAAVYSLAVLSTLGVA